MGPSFSTGRHRVLALLIAINVAVFVLQSIATPERELWLIQVFGLSIGGLETGGWWEFLTHAFLHGNFLHLALNMISLFFAGRIVDEEVGETKFLILYLLGAIGGGVAQMIAGPPEIRLIGASGAVFAVMIAFTTIYREQEILALVFFVIPLRFRAKFLAWGLVGFTVIAIIFGIEPWIGHAAHLGGAITGYLFARVLGFGKVTPPERWLHRLTHR